MYVSTCTYVNGIKMSLLVCLGVPQAMIKYGTSYIVQVGHGLTIGLLREDSMKDSVLGV